MRSYRSRRRTRAGRNDGSLWLSFSDLMSSLLLIIILVLFYIMYQYFDMYEINMAEIARQQYDLDAANATLEAERTKLTAAEQALMSQQIRLNAAESELESAEAILASQQAELAAAQTLLAEKESEISSQQTSLDTLSQQLGAQQTLLESQQQQIEQLVGMKTRIITSLSSALKSANISATVDQASGAIALESDVLFSTGQYKLTDEGRARIDDFLPVYLDVLFSEEYLPYVSEIIIEGHTDSLGDYITNLQLSQERAGAVASYVLSDSYTAITAQQRRILRSVATANGRSFSDPVLDASGREDMDASRRVVFKFRLTDEQMIEQMKSILEQSEETAAAIAAEAEANAEAAANESGAAETVSGETESAATADETAAVGTGETTGETPAEEQPAASETAAEDTETPTAPVTDAAE